MADSAIPCIVQLRCAAPIAKIIHSSTGAAVVKVNTCFHDSPGQLFRQELAGVSGVQGWQGQVTLMFPAPSVEAGVFSGCACRRAGISTGCHVSLDVMVEPGCSGQFPSLIGLGSFLILQPRAAAVQRSPRCAVRRDHKYTSGCAPS